MAILPLTDLAIFRKGNDVNVIVETTTGSRNKWNHQPELDVFELSGVLPEGSVFPYDFGLIPSKQGEDGDPLDLLVLLDESVPTGCFISARLIGVIVANQTEKRQATDDSGHRALFHIPRGRTSIQSFRNTPLP